jgi:hypothetical protein
MNSPAPREPLIASQLGWFSHAVEFAEFSPRFSLFATLFDTGFFVILAALQLSFYTVYLQFFLQLTDGVLKISANFNFYHRWLR